MPRCILAALLLLWPSFAFATEPCQPLSEAQFRRQVLNRSDLVIGAAVEDFSQARDNTQPRWTKVKTIHAYKGKAPQTVTIDGWQAKEMPLFGYKPGDGLLLFLKKTDAGYELTQSEWKDCVPSVMNLGPDGKVYPNFTADNPDYDHKRIAAGTLTSYLLSARTH